MTIEGPGPFGGGDLFSQLQSLQAGLESAQAAAGNRSVEGKAAGGAVRIEATGELSFTRVTISPGVVDPDDVSLLEDLVLAALRDLAARLEELRRETMGSAVTSALGGLFGSLGDFAALSDDDDDDDDEDLEDEDEEEDEEEEEDNGAGAGPRA